MRTLLRLIFRRPKPEYTPGSWMVDRGEITRAQLDKWLKASKQR